MSDRKWKSGDLVRLKSGGPVMTVDYYKIDNEGQVVCHWFRQCYPGILSSAAGACGTELNWAQPECWNFSEDALEAVK